MNSIERIAKLLRPRSIAIAGATEDRSKIVGRLMPVLTAGGYKGKIFPINPRYAQVDGFTCYPSIDRIPEEVDHCIIAVPRERVLGLIAECRAKGVGSASIYTSGYAEAGEEGAAAQAELQRAAGDMIFIGPNCMGFANQIDRVIATPSQVVAHDSTPGDVALITQSGGLGYATFGYFAQQIGVRFSHMINTGNSAGISTADLAEFLFEDASTRAIVVITESEAVGVELVRLVARRGLVKPIVMMKLGRGETGARMALSHTGSLAGDYRLLRDIAEQHGIVCTEDVDDTLGAANLLRNGFRGHHASGLAAMSISGGNVTLFADQVDGHKLEFAELSATTCERLRSALPDFITIHNPVDVTSYGVQDPAVNDRIAEILLEDPGVHTLIPIITTIPDYTPVCSQLAALKRRCNAPIIAMWNGGAYEDRSQPMLVDAGIPIFKSAGNLARSLDRLRRAHLASAHRHEAAVAPGPCPPLPAATGALAESAAFGLLHAAGVPVPRVRRSSRAGLAATAAEVGYPIVLKSDMEETHLSDRGGVIVGIGDAHALERARERIAAMPGDDLLVAQYLPGHEIIVSTFRHPRLGPVLMVGSGGALVEMLSDVRFVGLPASRGELAQALAGTAVGRIVKEGFRGATGFDAAVDLLVRVAAFALAAGPALAQIELNPVTIGRHGAAAVDAAIVLAAQA